MKFSFKNDYSGGAHPNVLKRLVETNNSMENGYGEDSISNSAREKIQQHLQSPNSKIFFVTGGTQANLLFAACSLKPYECILAAESAHINIHEAGAIEATGHKIETIPTTEGKLTVELLEKKLPCFEDHHMVKPKMVFISNITEWGTVYDARELAELYDWCEENQLWLYMDGARLGSALTHKNIQLTLEDCSRYTHAFYIGGTKNGALFGEAMVINAKELQKDFLYVMKQRGALLAKGRGIGAQFDALFSENLFWKITEIANKKSLILRGNLENEGIRFYIDSFSNLQFPIIPKEWIGCLLEKFEFYPWKEFDKDHSVIRLVCGWDTPEEAIHSITSEIRLLKEKSIKQTF